MVRVANNKDFVGDKKTIRAKEVAVNYGIGLSTVWHYVKLGYIKAYKITDKVTVFNVKELDEFFGYTA